MAADVHSMTPQAGDLVRGHVQFAGESSLVGSNVFDEQAPHDFPPDRPGQLPLKEALE